MIKHIVLFKLGPFESVDERIYTLKTIRERLLELPNKIQELKNIEVGININREEEYDLSLTCSVNSMDDLKAYANHPEHVKIAKEMLAPLKLSRACVDYEI